MPSSQEPDWDAIRAAYIRGGEPVRAIAKRYGIGSTSTIYRRMRDEDWPRRGGWGKARLAEKAAQPGLRPGRRKAVDLRKLKARMLEVLNEQVEQLAAINERNPKDGALSERSARAMTAIVTAIDKVMALDARLGSDSGGNGSGREKKAIHILRQELAERLGFIGPI